MTVSPNYPMPWLVPGAPSGDPYVYTATPNRPGVQQTGNTEAALPGDPGMPGGPPNFATSGKPTYNDAIRKMLMRYGWDPDEIDVYIAGLEKQQEAFTAASGFSNRQLQAQIDNAKMQRKTALETARISAEASRYGTDVQARTAERQLAQQAAQFQQTHGLEVAKAYTQYASTPDMMFARNDFMSAMGQVGQGMSPRPMAAQGQPQAKTWQDFAALSGYGGNPSVAAGAGGGQAQMNMAAGGGAGSAADARLKAIKAVGQAIPPSDTPGNDNQDWMAINAIANLYAAGRPRDVAALGAPRRKIAQAGLARGGYDPALVEHEYQRGLPNRGRPNAA